MLNIDDKMKENKHAVQAAGADPSWCNSTNRQNCKIAVTLNQIFDVDVLGDIECPKPVDHILFFYYKTCL